MSPSSADYEADSTREQKDSGTIARELEDTRSELDETLERLQAKLSPRQVLDRTVAAVRDNTRALADNLGGSVRQNPLPLMIVGAGLLWVIAARGRRFRIQSEVERVARRGAHAEGALEDLSELLQRSPKLTSALPLVLAAVIGYALTAAESSQSS